MSEEENPIGSWFLSAGLLLGWESGQLQDKALLQRIALAWSAHQLRNTIKFRPRLLSYR